MPQTLEGEAVLELLDAEAELGAVDGLPVLAVAAALGEVRGEDVGRLGGGGVDLVDLVHGSHGGHDVAGVLVVLLGVLVL